MGEERRFEPVYESFPADPEARWGLLREFVRRWARVELGGAGRRSSRARGLETVTGRPTGTGLHEWMSLVDDLAAVPRLEWMLFDGPGLYDMVEVLRVPALALTEWDEDGPHAFLVSYDDAGLADPPVQRLSAHNVRTRYDAGPDRNRVLTLSEFATQYFLISRMAGTSEGFGFTPPDVPSTLRRLAEEGATITQLAGTDLAQGAGWYATTHYGGGGQVIDVKVQAGADPSCLPPTLGDALRQLLAAIDARADSGS